MKILYVTTISNTINAFLIPHINYFYKNGHEIDICCNYHDNQPLKLDDREFKHINIMFNRNPLKNNVLKLIKDMKKVVHDGNYDIVHVHTPIASFITRIACKNFKSVRVVYTAHGFHFHRGSTILSWLIYYPIEKYLSKYTDQIITINSEDYNICKNKFGSNKCTLIHGVGIDIKKIENTKHVDNFREQIGVSSNSIIILSVGELNKNKNHYVVLKALNKLRHFDFHYYICGAGKLKTKYQKYIENNYLQNKVSLLGYRDDIYNFLQVADIFVFPSIREGLPVSIMEAMYFNLPIVCSSCRGNIDLLSKDNAVFISKNDYREYSTKISDLLNDKSKRNVIGSNNRRNLAEYTIESVLFKLNNVYKNMG